MASCADAPRDFRADPVAEQDAGTPRLELGKEYPLPDEAAHIKEISDLFTGMSERKLSAGRAADAARCAHQGARVPQGGADACPRKSSSATRVGLFKAPVDAPGVDPVFECVLVDRVGRQARMFAGWRSR